jgi:hypothetical protein
MKNVFLVFLLLISIHVIKAEAWAFTVIAEHGLSIRTKPNLESKIISTVPFGEIVLSENPNSSSHLDTIDGEIGYWLKVRYNQQTGFMFTGFLVFGDVFPLSRADTIPYVIIDEWAEYSEEGKYCPGFYDPSHYIPNFYWYGIKNLDTTTIITSTIVLPEYNPNRWNKDDKIQFDVKLRVENQKSFDFVFGSKYKLEPCEIKSNKYFGLDSKIGVFIYPEQSVRIQPFITGYRIHGSEEINLLKGSENKINRKYTLDLIRYTDTILIKNMNKVFELNRPARIHAEFENPTLYWSGDINNDGNPDLILKRRTMSESYAGGRLHLIISQVENGKIEYYATSTGIDDQKIK